MYRKICSHLQKINPRPSKARQIKLIIYTRVTNVDYLDLKSKWSSAPKQKKWSFVPKSISLTKWSLISVDLHVYHYHIHTLTSLLRHEVIYRKPDLCLIMNCPDNYASIMFYIFLIILGCKLEEKKKRISNQARTTSEPRLRGQSYTHFFGRIRAQRTIFIKIIYVWKTKKNRW